MNGRAAKILRRVARDMAMGKADKEGNAIPERSIDYTETNRDAGKNKDGKPQMFIVNSFRNQGTVRGIYRKLKQAYDNTSK